MNYNIFYYFINYLLLVLITCIEGSVKFNFFLFSFIKNYKYYI